MLKAGGILLLLLGTAGLIRELLSRQRRHLKGLQMMLASLRRMEQQVRCIGVPAQLLLFKEAELVESPLADYYVRLGQCIERREQEDWQQVLREVIPGKGDNTFSGEELELFSDTLRVMFIREQPGVQDACGGYFDTIAELILANARTEKEREKVTVSLSVTAAALLLLLLL